MSPMPELAPFGDLSYGRSCSIGHTSFIIAIGRAMREAGISHGLTIHYNQS